MVRFFLVFFSRSLKAQPGSGATLKQNRPMVLSDGAHAGFPSSDVNVPRISLVQTQVSFRVLSIPSVEKSELFEMIL